MVQVKIMGDGNCLYRAIAYIYFGDSNKWRDVMASGLAYLFANRSLFSSFVAIDYYDFPAGCEV